MACGWLYQKQETSSPTIAPSNQGLDRVPTPDLRSFRIQAHTRDWPALIFACQYGLGLRVLATASIDDPYQTNFISGPRLY